MISAVFPLTSVWPSLFCALGSDLRETNYTITIVMCKSYVTGGTRDNFSAKRNYAITCKKNSLLLPLKTFLVYCKYSNFSYGRRRELKMKKPFYDIQNVITHFRH